MKKEKQPKYYVAKTGTPMDKLGYAVRVSVKGFDIYINDDCEVITITGDNGKQIDINDFKE